jgi:CubicO group peptidase (beta-lactamase class C family)
MAVSDLPRLLTAAVDDLEVTALAAGAVVDSRVHFVCRGVRARERIDPHTVFYGASVTKQLIGLVLARLTLDGVADPEDLVSRWLPELSHRMVGVRLRHLLHHTSGLGDLADPGLGVPRSNAEVVARFTRRSPAPEDLPGLRFAYNNGGYVLLAEALSRAARQPIGQLASTQLFTPLALPDTRLGGDPMRLSGTADPPGTIGDGGLWTSIADLITWLRACNEQWAGAAALRLAESPGCLADGSPLDYAWGVRVTARPYGRLITHGGSWSPWVAKTVRVPEQGVAVALLSVGGGERRVSDSATQLAELLSVQAEHRRAGG